MMEEMEETPRMTADTAPTAAPDAEEAERRERAAALGRQLAALRRQVRRVCALPGCGREFVGTTRRQYCCHQHAALALWRTKFGPARAAERAKARAERGGRRRRTSPAPDTDTAPTAAPPPDDA